MDDERTRIADIGEVGEEPYVLHGLHAGIVAAADAEGQHRPGAVGDVALGEVLIVVVPRQARHS